MGASVAGRVVHHRRRVVIVVIEIAEHNAAADIVMVVRIGDRSEAIVPVVGGMAIARHGQRGFTDRLAAVCCGRHAERRKERLVGEVCVWTVEGKG